MKRIPVRSIDGPIKEPNLSQSFVIRRLSSVLNGQDLVQELHRHDYYYLLILQKAKGSHAIDFIPYDVRNNSIFFLRPGQVHQLKLKVGAEGYLIGFQRHFCKMSDQLMLTASSKNYYPFKNTQFEKINRLLDHTFQEYAGKQKGFQHIIKANLNILFVELTRQSDKANENSPRSHHQERLDKLMQLIETHIADVKRASEYADMLHLSLFQLNSITKNLLGKTCSEVIDDHIILEAKRSLLGTSNQVSDIAETLGYSDVSYFIRFFKKHTGSSPEAFRQNFR